MKKRNLKAKLLLSKSTVSNFKASQVKGGTGDTREIGCDTSQIFVCLSMVDCPTANCTVGCTVGCPSNNCPSVVSCQISCFNELCEPIDR